MQGLLLEPGTVRGTGSVYGASEGIAVNVMGRVFCGYSDTTTAPALAVAHERCSHIEDVAERALNYAVLVSYVWPFSDGNKRTARFMADGLLMSHGYDAVEIPAVSRRAVSRREYTRALADMSTCRPGRTPAPTWSSSRTRPGRTGDRPVQLRTSTLRPVLRPFQVYSTGRRGEVRGSAGQDRGRRAPSSDGSRDPRHPRHHGHALMLRERTDAVAGAGLDLFSPPASGASPGR